MTFLSWLYSSTRYLAGPACVAVLLITAACAPVKYEAKPLDVIKSEQNYNARTLHDPELGEFMKSYQDAALPWPLTDWNLQALTLAAWYYHPDLQVAIAEYRKTRTHVDTVNERPNPGIHIPLEHHSDTSGGKSPWLTGVLFDFIYEREGKRQARHAQAEAEAGAAKINISAGAWDIYSAVRQAYINYYSVLKSSEQITTRAGITEEIVKLLLRRKELGHASGYETGVMQIDLQRLRLQQAGMKYEMTDAVHVLAGALGMPAAALEHVQLKFVDLETPGPADMSDIELRQLALTHRLDIRKALMEYSAYEAALRLEIEKQYPDLTLSPGFVFDQGDMIWTIGAAWILPLLHPQNAGVIRETLAQREIKQAEFLALQARAINELESARSRFAAQKESLQQAQKFLQESLALRQQTQKQFDLEYADRLELTRSQFGVAAAEQAVLDLRMSVLKAAGQLEDAIQYPLFTRAIYQLADTGLE